jgi:hypothetical protein
MSTLRHKVILAGTIAALSAGSLGPVAVAQAKHGSDDRATHHTRAHHRAHAGHHRGDDRSGDDHGAR